MYPLFSILESTIIMLDLSSEHKKNMPVKGMKRVLYASAHSGADVVKESTSSTLDILVFTGA